MADFTGGGHFFVAFRCPASLEAEGDAVFARHVEWMARTHPREGDDALLQYTVSKRTEEDGTVLFLLSEIYATPSGVANHGRLAHEDEEDSRVQDLLAFADKCEGIGWGSSDVVHSLWRE